MGVQGLLTYILDCGHLRRVKLSILAHDFQQETGQRPKLLFNFSEIGVKMWSSPVSVLKEVGDYPVYTSICGPDFHLVADRARCFVKALRSLGIEPVFFIDVPLYDLSNSKVLVKLENRRAQKMARNYQMQQILEHTTAQFVPANHCNDLVYRQILCSLGAESAELVYCVHESCKPAMARYAQTHDDVCGVVADNSDFAIFSGCVLFPLAMFDCEKLTGLVGGISIAEDPHEIVSMAISSAGLAESLDIQEDQLPDLAVLCGTELASYIHRLSVLTALGVEGSEVTDIAAWLKSSDSPLMDNHIMKEFCQLDPQFRDALQQKYSEYSVKAPPVVSPDSASPVYSLIEKELLGHCEMALSAVKQGIVWLRVPFENLNLGQPSILDMLCPVRRALYILLGVYSVDEYGRTMAVGQRRIIGDCSDREAVLASGKRFHSLRALDDCGKLAAVYGLSTILSVQCVSDVTQVMDNILKSVLKFPDMEWARLHKLAFICTSLRLLALLNKSSRPFLAISDSELDALLLSTLTCASEGTLLPHIVHILPSVKAVAMGEWFCTVMDIIYEMSRVLGVTEDTPEPRNVFYPMAFIPYHMALGNHTGLTASQRADIDSVKTAMKTALSLPSVVEFSSHVFDTDKDQVLQELIALCDAALGEVLGISDELLPRAVTAPIEELLAPSQQQEEQEEDEEDEDSQSGEESGETDDQETESPRVWGREELPIMEHCETILELIADHQVVCIQGETGCGKSSQVPQFILKQFPDSKILVSQPNSLAAKKLSERVSEEVVDTPHSLVTYCDELHTEAGDARIIYGTNDFLLQTLLANHDTCSYTHIILDEIHERTTNIDFGLFLAQQLAMKLPTLKIILMSATLQGKLFVEYFRRTLGTEQVADPYFVGIRRFPVHVFYIDELSELITKKNDTVQNDAMKELIHLQSKLQGDSTILAHSPEVSMYAQDVCINLILSQPEPGDSVLVFLPGMADMIDLHAALSRKLQKLGVSRRFRIFVFHNQVPIEDEKEAFEKPYEGQANIIISHTIAESSITFPHLKLVINFGIRRYMIYNPNTHLSKLTRQWCSKSSCIQREGRVGRMSEGTAIHLIMRQDYEKLANFNIPEIIYAPLSKTVLEAKQIVSKGCGVLLPSQLLSTLIEPPSLLQFEAALQDLIEIGAIMYNPEISPNKEEAEITLLGEFSLGLPLDLNLCRLVLLGILFGCPNDAVVMAASLSMYKDIFTMPTRLVMNNMRRYCDSLARSTFSRLRLDAGCYSKPIMIRNMYLEWLSFFNSHHTGNASHRYMANQFSFQCCIRVTRLLHFETAVADIARAAAKWLPAGSRAHTELVALSNADKGLPPQPVMCSNSYFTEEEVSSSPPPSPSLRPNSTSYVPPHLRNLRIHRTRHQLHFCDDNLLLKALITATSPDELMYGKTCVESSEPIVRAFARRCVSLAQEERYFPSETLTMDLSEVSDCDLWAEKLEETNETTIRELYSSLPPGYCFPVKVRVDKEEDAAVINFSSSLEAVQYIAGIARDVGLGYGQNIIDRNSTAELSKVALELQVLWRIGECRLGWEVDNVNAVFPLPRHPHKLVWHMLDKQKTPVNSVHLNYRNPTGFMCLFKEPQYPYLAVSTGSFITDAKVSMATDITLLPPAPQSLMMILAFQLPTSKTELLIDRREGRVKGLRVNRIGIPCADIEAHISVESLAMINRLRHSLSRALSSSLRGRQIPLCELGLNELQENLRTLLTATPAATSTPQPPSDTPQREKGEGQSREKKVEGKTQVEEEPVSAGDAESPVWEMITPGKLLVATAATEPGHQLYYPELRCSLLGSEPYASAPAHYEQTATTTTRIEYKETVSTKLIMENFHRVENSDDSDDDQHMCDSVELATFSGSGWLIDRKKMMKVPKEKQTPLTDGSEIVAEKDVVVGEGSASAVSGAVCEQKCNASFSELMIAKLEQEIVRHLQRNNKVEFLSELRVQRRIKHICSLIRVTLNVPFFLQRPNMFQVREVEEGGEGEDATIEGREYLVVLDQSKWQEVDSEDEEPVLPRSVRLLRKSRKVVTSLPQPSPVGVAGGEPVVTEGTQTDDIPVSASPSINTPVDKAENKEKSSQSKPLTATKTVKLPDTVTSTNTPHTSYSVSEEKEKLDIHTVKKLEPAVGKTSSAASSKTKPKGATPTEATEHTKPKGATSTEATEHIKPKGATPTEGTEHIKPKGATPTEATEHIKPKGATPTETVEHTKPKGATPTETVEHTKPKGATPTEATEHTKPKGATPTETVEHTKPKGATPTEATEHTQLKGATLTETVEHTKPKGATPTEATKPKAATSTDTTEHTKPLSKEPAKKASSTTASKKKETGPPLGTDDHLALFVHDYIKKSGGEVRLTFLRKEAFREYYNRHPSLRYGGYRYLRKAFLLDYPEYFKIYEGDKKALYVKALKEQHSVSSHHKDSSKATHPTQQDIKSEKKTTKQGPNKKALSEPQELAQNLVTDVASEKTQHTRTSVKADKPQDGARPPPNVAVDKKSSKAEPGVHFVHVPNPSRRSQEPVTVSELDTAISRATASHGLSQLRATTHTGDRSQQLTARPAPQPQPATSGHVVHVRTLESTTQKRPPLLTTPTPVMGTPSPPYPSPQIRPAVATASHYPSHSPTPPPPHSVALPGEREEEAWHSSEESWLSEDEFDSPHSSPRHVAKYLHNYLHTHSFPFGCRVSELDRVYQNDYRRRFRSQKVAAITTDWLKSHSSMFKLRDETFLKLREHMEHVEMSSLRGRPYTPEHINDYFVKYLRNKGVVCSLTEAEDVFEKNYKKDFKMPLNPHIWFVGDNFFKRSPQFLLFNSTVVFGTEGKSPC